MQRISTFIGGVLAVVAMVALAIFALQNTQSVQVSFLGTTFATAPALVALAAAMAALLVAIVLLLPSRVAAGRRSSALSAQYAQREQELTSIRTAHTELGSQHEIVLADYTRLRDEHGRILAERDELLARLAPPAPAPEPAMATPEFVQDTAQDTVIATSMESPAENPAENAAPAAEPVQLVADVGPDVVPDVTADVVREDVVVAQATPAGGALPVLDLTSDAPPVADPAQDVVLVSTASAAPAAPDAADLATNSATSGLEAQGPEALVAKAVQAAPDAGTAEA